MEEKKQNIGLGEKLKAEHLSRKKGKGLKRFLLAVTILIIAYGLYYAFFRDGGSQYEMIETKKMDIKESVEITGNVEAGATINLTFRESGQVETINADVGDDLDKGDVIAALKNREQNLRLQQARANLAGAQANLAERVAGYTDQQIDIAEANVLKADAAAKKIGVDYTNAEEELVLLRQKYEQDEVIAQLQVDDAKAKYDFALKNKDNIGKTSDQAIDTAIKDLEAQLYNTGSSIQQTLVNLKSIIVNDGNSLLGQDYVRLDYRKSNQAVLLYFQVKNDFEPMFDEFKNQTDYTVEDLEAYALREQNHATKLLESLKLTIDALSILHSSSTLSEAKITEFKAKLLADSSSLSTSFAALNVRYQAILNAKLNKNVSGDTRDSEVVSAENFYNQQLENFEKIKIDHKVDINSREANINSLKAQYDIQLADINAAKAALDEKKVGPRSVDLAFLKTQITANELAVSLAQEAVEKTLLRAPISGVLARRNVEVGEDVMAATNSLDGGVVQMISDEKFKIDAEIAEVDINKLNVGDKATIVLDAVSDDLEFEGTISTIDPVETVVQDVVFYKAEVVVESDDDRIKPGMTANVEIVLREANDVMTVQEKAIQTDGERKYVRVLEGDAIKQIDVETGIRDLQGNVEVKGDLSEGMEIILRTLN